MTNQSIIAIFHRQRKNNPKNSLGTQKTKTAKAILSKKNATGSITTPNFKSYYRAILLKTTQPWQGKETDT